MGRPGAFEFESAPSLPGMDRLSKYGMGGVRHLVHRMWKLDIQGRDNVPLDGPAIITPNHLSFCDSVFVPAALPRRVWAIGKGEYMDSWKTKHIFPAMGMIPVDRTGGDAAQAALDTAASVLAGGHLFMIYPEGTRSRSGNLHKGRTGAARLAIRCDAPIVPVGHAGTVEVQTPDTVVMKPFKVVTVRIGAPMWAQDYGDPADPRTLRKFTDAVMFEIAELSGQDYVDEYAGKKVEVATGATSEATPSAAPTPTKPRRMDIDRPHITPSRPSVIGSSPTRIPRPPMRSVPDGSIEPSSGHPLVTVPLSRRVAAAAGAGTGGSAS